jgi:hypothetical protein
LKCLSKASCIATLSSLFFFFSSFFCSFMDDPCGVGVPVFVSCLGYVARKLSGYQLR